MIPKILKNFNLFIDDVGFAGKVEELVLPKLNLKLDEYRAGGMDVPIQLDMGMEKLECDFTLSDYDPDVIQKFGLYVSEQAQRSLKFKGGFSDETAISPVIVEVNGAWTSMDLGSWKAGERTSLKITVAARYYKLTIDGNDLVEIDVANMQRMIGGVDQLAGLSDAIS